MTIQLKQIGQFRIIEKIGAGIAQVYLAEHPRYRQIALKVLPPSFNRNIKAENRFKQEAHILQRMRHPNILRMYEASTYITPNNEVYYYMATEYQRDGSLHGLLHRSGGRLPEAKAVSLTVQIADALAFAHNNSVIHRDIKPSNVLLNGDRAILCDFNVARDLERSSTGVGMLGTLAYMSPEQTLGNRNFVRRGSDIYSFGIVAYEMLTGYQPRNNPDLADLIVVRMIQQEPLPPLRKIAPHITPAIASIIDRCIAQERNQRYDTMDQVAYELRRATEQRGYVVPPQPQPYMERANSGNTPAHGHAVGSAQAPASLPLGFWLGIGGVLLVLVAILVMVLMMMTDSTTLQPVSTPHLAQLLRGGLC
ncbi:serine/threonine protein kinase [bacterium]|nr:serine/threonine protein kinase [bacterium]